MRARRLVWLGVGLTTIFSLATVVLDVLDRSAQSLWSNVPVLTL